MHRLIEFAPLYYDLKTFPDGETKRALLKVQNKKLGKMIKEEESRPAKKQRRIK